MSIAVAVVGPTAAGKSALGVALCERLGGSASGESRAEVINADSMQLYRGMDIGTAKITPAEARGVPHHLFDIWPVTEPASAAVYQRLARPLIESITTPVLVGGSGLYVRAALDRMEFPGTDPRLRAELEAELAAVGPGELHRRLAAADPAAAELILPSNGRRIVRALEVVALTGSFTAALPTPEPVYPAAWIGLDLGPAELDERVALRVDRMWAAGFVDEVAGLVEQGLREGRTASRALGYQQVLRQLAGEYTAEEAKEETVRATRRFVRRQRSWFRRDERVHWLDAARPNVVDAALAVVEAAAVRVGAP